MTSRRLSRGIDCSLIAILTVLALVAGVAAIEISPASPFWAPGGDAIVPGRITSADSEHVSEAFSLPDDMVAQDGGSVSLPGAVHRALIGGPLIASVSPQIASAGTNTEIRIAGTGFGTKASRESPADVGFTSIYGAFWASGRTDPAWNPDDIVSWSDTEIRVRVPNGRAAVYPLMDGAQSGGVWVVTDANLSSNRVPFAVTFRNSWHRWSATSAPFQVNDNCPNQSGGGEAIRRAAATWNAALPSSFQINCSRTSTCTTAVMDGVSLIAWGPIARTVNYIVGDQIVEADIVLNASSAWTTGAATGTAASIERRMLHEFGFTLGLDSLVGEEAQGPSDAGKVTFRSIADRYGNTNTLTLHPADRAGVDYIYNGGSPNPPLLAAAFTTDTTSGTAPLTVQFADATIGGVTNEWHWDFGDGATSTLEDPVHTYTSPGNYTVALTASALGYPSDTIRAYSRITVNASLALPAVPGGENPPGDTDADRLYDDVNGNGRRDFNDVVLYFNQMSWIAAHEPIESFDYNGNGRIDFADVVWLFNHL